MEIKTPLEDKQTFNDGICEIANMENRAEAGDKPDMVMKTRYARVPYEKRTAGVTRMFFASAEGVDISFVLRVPAAYRISTMDICKMGKDIYIVRRVQLIRNTEPPSQDLELMKEEHIYDIEGISRHAAAGQR